MTSKKTKVSDLTQSVKVEKKPIEFKIRIQGNGTTSDCIMSPKDWDNVQKVAKIESFDIILAWDDSGEHTNKRAYFGHWNDGYVDND